LFTRVTPILPPLCTSTVIVTSHLLFVCKIVASNIESVRRSFTRFSTVVVVVVVVVAADLNIDQSIFNRFIALQQPLNIASSATNADTACAAIHRVARSLKLEVTTTVAVIPSLIATDATL